MKTRYFALTLLVSSLFNFTFGQSKNILNILNTELRKEVKKQFKWPHFNGDTIQIIKKFSIDNNNLSVKAKNQIHIVMTIKS